MWKSRSWLLLLVLLACGLLWLWRALEAREGRALARGTNEFRDASARVEEGGLEPGRAMSATAEPAAAAQRVGGAIDGVLTLAVRVLDWNDDHPLAGARVTALEEEPPRIARTDAEGRCALVVRDVPECVRLRIEAEGYVQETDECARRGPVAFGLSRAARVHGRVLAADTEEPIAGARIAQEFGLGERVVVESGPDGSYALAEVPCGMTARVSLSAAGFATCTREFQLDPLAGDLAQDLHLARGAEVKGRVVDWESGAGLAGALVSGLEADADGRFAGRLLAAPGTARTRVEVTAEGHASLNAPVELGTGAELEFRLPRLAFVAGRVLDASGSPLQDAHVFLQVRGPHPDPDGRALDTGPLSTRPAGWAFGAEPSYGRTLAGDFRLAVLPWCSNVNLRASKDGFTDGETTLALSGEPATTQTVELRLERARVAGARVWGNVSVNGCSSEVLRGTLAWRGPTRGGEVRFAGGYELVAEPGELELTVVLDDVHAPLEGASVRVQAREDERVWLPIELRAPGAALSGHVRFADGRPVAGAQLGATCLANGKGHLVFTAQTNGRGEYSLAVPDIGQRFTVSVVSRLEHFERGDVAAGTTALDFVLPALHPLLVRAVDAATGVPLRVSNAVRLAARTSGADFEPVHVEAGTDMDGWTELWLAAERVDLLAQPAHRDLDGYGLVVRRDIDLRSHDAGANAGVVPRVELRLERAAPLVLELDPKGAPWPDEHELALLEEELCDAVQLSRQGWESKLHGLRALRHVDFDEHGRAELAGFGPGRYRFQVFPADVALDPGEIVVERGGGAPVSLRWRHAH